MNLNILFNVAYRLIAVTFLTAVFFVAAGYAFLVAFYVVNTSYAAPVTLSPSQDRVLSFQPQVAALEASLYKQRIELQTAQATHRAGDEQLRAVTHLVKRALEAGNVEASQLATTMASLSSALKEKQDSIDQTTITLGDALHLLSATSQEQRAGLITADQAALRKLSIQSAINAASDAKAQALALKIQMQQARAGASTLRGGSMSIATLGYVRQHSELAFLKAQLSIQQETTKATIDALEASTAALDRVIAVAKTSPYYAALSAPLSVAFVPYENLSRVTLGAIVYDCLLQVVLCQAVGTVTKVYEAEEYADHPLFRTKLKGRFVGVDFGNSTAAQSPVVFIGVKPLLI